MAWQVVIFAAGFFTVVQVVPYIIEEEIMERMGERGRLLIQSCK
jgi:hypothetical protein